MASWFLIAQFADSETEKENDLIFIETIGNILSAAIENRLLIEEMINQESLKRELEVAEKIQKQLLVQDFSGILGADVFAENIAHHKIGGDFYDVIPRGEKGIFPVYCRCCREGNWGGRCLWQICRLIYAL